MPRTATTRTSNELNFMLAMIGWLFFLSAVGQERISGAEAVRVQAVPTAVTQAASVQQKRRDPTRFARSLIDEAGDRPVDVDSLFVPMSELDSTTSAEGKSFAVSVQSALLPATSVTPTRRIFEVTLHPGAGYVEKFLVAPAAGSVARPMLVAFHKFGNSAYDILYNTSLFQEGLSRGWHVVAPLGASGAHFSSIESQINTEAVLNWMVNHFPVDKSRVYAVGFSMGGGAALNYAARHLDPNGVMIAAVVNHTGVVSLLDAYANEPLAQPIMDFWFGDGTPNSHDVWEMQRSSVISFNPATLQVDTSSDLARNLMHVNTRTLRASQDPVAYLIPENDVLHAHLQSLGAVFGQHALYVYPGSTHSWDLLDEHITCDWLRPQRLKLPKSGRTLADRDATYFYFAIKQGVAGQFTPFEWQLDPPSNMLGISATANLTEIVVERATAGLSATADFTVTLSTADGLPDVLRLRGWNHLPINVLRDGVATASWSYNSSTGALTLTEYDGTNSHTWRVVP